VEIYTKFYFVRDLEFGKQLGKLILDSAGPKSRTFSSKSQKLQATRSLNIYLGEITYSSQSTTEIISHQKQIKG
jgi:hypothetical protein